MSTVIGYILAAATFAAFVVSNLVVEDRNQQVATLEQQAAGLRAEVIRLERELELRPKLTEEVTVTAYTACEEECNSDPGNTAFMTAPVPGTVAVSPDLLEAGWAPGMKVYLKGFGVFVINDLMNPRWDRRIDIVVHTKEQARKIGHNEGVLAALITEG